MHKRFYSFLIQFEPFFDRLCSLWYRLCNLCNLCNLCSLVPPPAICANLWFRLCQTSFAGARKKKLDKFAASSMFVSVNSAIDKREKGGALKTAEGSRMLRWLWRCLLFSLFPNGRSYEKATGSWKGWRCYTHRQIFSLTLFSNFADVKWGRQNALCTYVDDSECQ
jgi:hypothetical protein